MRSSSDRLLGLFGRATRVAADLAKRFDASLTLTFVYDPLAYALPDAFALVPHRGRYAARRASRPACREPAAGARGGSTSRGDQAAARLVAAQSVDFASRGEFDLIVMGSHGRTGLQHLVMGSVAERVVRLARRPVLTVKHKPHVERHAHALANPIPRRDAASATA